MSSKPQDSRALLSSNKFFLPPLAFQPSEEGDIFEEEEECPSAGFPQVYIDPESIKTQKEAALSMIESQSQLSKDHCRTEYEAQKATVLMRAQHEITIAEATIERSRTQAIFALDQQHQKRRLEIEQKSQEQKMQIESTASQLMLQAQQQKLQREMNDRLIQIQGGRAVAAMSTVSLFQTNQNSAGSDMTRQNSLFSIPHMFTSPVSQGDSTSGSKRTQ
jgi:trehalose/maltose hydrolase-like predicted phosphorylase